MDMGFPLARRAQTDKKKGVNQDGLSGYRERRKKIGEAAVMVNLSNLRQVTGAMWEKWQARKLRELEYDGDPGRRSTIAAEVAVARGLRDETIPATASGLASVKDGQLYTFNKAGDLEPLPGIEVDVELEPYEPPDRSELEAVAKERREREWERLVDATPGRKPGEGNPNGV